MQGTLLKRSPEQCQGAPLCSLAVNTKQLVCQATFPMAKVCAVPTSASALASHGLLLLPAPGGPMLLLQYWGVACGMAPVQHHGIVSLCRAC